MRALLTVIVAGVLLSGTVFADRAEAGDRRGRGPKRGRVEARHYGDGYYGDRYFRGRDVVVIRDYYRPYYRPVPRGIRASYVRGHYLPPGWRHRVVPVPVYLEPSLGHVPYGYHRGVIDAHAVIYNSSGLIIDVAAIF